MKIVKKAQAKTFKNSDKCIAYEYPMSEKEINGAIIELSGRYPDEGRVVNKKCKELICVIDGSGILVVEGREIKLNKDDQVLIEPKERYYFEGNLKMLISCAPAWYPEQYSQVG